MFSTTYDAVNYRSVSEINSAMGRVYGHMSLAVIISMIVSYSVGLSPELMQFFFTGVMRWVVMFAPLVAIFAIMFTIDKVDRTGAQAMLYGFAALLGLSFATIFVVFKLGSVVSAFMGAAILFAIMSGYGYFTKKSLDSLGKWLLVGLISIIVASIINIFIGSTIAQMVISALAIIIFLGLTAYDTQKIREEISVANNGIAEIRGALVLYMNFINLFINLLQLFGDRK